ncbi:phosphate ABC transporter permease subunit PstC [Faecalispora anaeroviscerum]|uniref:phosphate ABC transporter permease subunit PstC n=1 Tax=Faecalispora anaeroviscerum TaxID=2991836 RepID=UPI0024BBC2B5|nr:phosphate ABC transporter permease subunit PstC [Faecalispora anaeroviscerum]
MERTMNGQEGREREQKRNAVYRWVAAGLGAASILSFLLPYITFVFRGLNYTVSGIQLAFIKGFWVVGPQQSGLVTIPLAVRASVVLGLLCAVGGLVLILLRKKTVVAGLLFLLSGISPLLVMAASGAIQTAVTELNVSQIEMRFLWPFFCTLLGGFLSSILALRTQGTERLAESVFQVFACVSIGSVILLTIYIISAGLPAILQIGAVPFLFGESWKPASDIFGILPMILSSIAGTAGAIVIGVPVGILTAVFLSETASPRLAMLVRPAVELLAGIPSVIYGFFGMLVIVPAIRNLLPEHTIGDSLLAVILILAVMILPTIVSVTETSLRAVPSAFREASLALGATQTETIFKVTIPAAKSGILAGVILGVGRAIGETMAVIMVAGNVANMPSLLGTVRLLTTGIAMEMSYASGLHREALFAIGLVLFVFIMIVNLLFNYISKKGVQIHAE